jgi:cholesterol transport system auxiliary component
MHMNRLIAILVLLTAGCSAITPTQTPPPTSYALDRPVAAPATVPSGPPLLKAPTLIVDPPIASSGFDSPRMAYARDAHKLEYFAHNRWIDPPARMLAPLLADAIEKRGIFRAVVMAPSAAAADFRLSTELVRLQHEFTSQPSRVRFTLRVILIEDETRKVVASREFEAVVPATSETPYGGVLAANIAVHTVLAQLATFCEEAARAAWIQR